jgi:hypothetical protein
MKKMIQFIEQLVYLLFIKQQNKVHRVEQRMRGDRRE